ncbi:MAG: translation initiation factor IF-3, partial [Verrucomicrobia bacterium]|nr:translation initiation factor IF-3 [Verrucomicrobiota bacterium]
AREVRVIGLDNNQLGVLSLNEALAVARSHGVDLVEIAPNATPPVCRLVDYGKFRYEQSKREKEAKRHQHATKVKEVQLSPTIDPHDFGVKLSHAVEFLCDEMKVKVTLKFRGREMAHQEYGFQTVERFIQAVAPFGHPDAPPKLIGRGLNVMLSPLPRNKRAKPPKGNELTNSINAHLLKSPLPATEPNLVRPSAKPVATTTVKSAGPAFNNNPFASLNLDVAPESAGESSGGS